MKHEIVIREMPSTPYGDDPRWRALADGTLPDDEREALREEAMESEEGRALWDLYRPFVAAERQRLFEGVSRQVREEAKRKRARTWRPILKSLAIGIVLGVVAVTIYVLVVRACGAALLSGPEPGPGGVDSAPASGAPWLRAGIDQPAGGQHAEISLDAWVVTGGVRGGSRDAQHEPRGSGRLRLRRAEVLPPHRHLHGEHPRRRVQGPRRTHGPQRAHRLQGRDHGHALLDGLCAALEDGQRGQVPPCDPRCRHGADEARRGLLHAELVADELASHQLLHRQTRQVPRSPLLAQGPGEAVRSLGREGEGSGDVAHHQEGREEGGEEEAEGLTSLAALSVGAWPWPWRLSLGLLVGALILALWFLGRWLYTRSRRAESTAPAPVAPPLASDQDEDEDEDEEKPAPPPPPPPPRLFVFDTNEDGQLMLGWKVGDRWEDASVFHGTVNLPFHWSRKVSRDTAIRTLAAQGEEGRRAALSWLGIQDAAPLAPPAITAEDEKKGAPEA